MSDDFMKSVKSYAESRSAPMRQVYDEAVDELCARIDAGDAVGFVPTAPGTGLKGRHVRMSAEVFDLWVAASARCRVHQSVFLARALRGYLAARGIDAD